MKKKSILWLLIGVLVLALCLGAAACKPNPGPGSDDGGDDGDDTPKATATQFLNGLLAGADNLVYEASLLEESLYTAAKINFEFFNENFDKDEVSGLHFTLDVKASFNEDYSKENKAYLLLESGGYKADGTKEAQKPLIMLYLEDDVLTVYETITAAEGNWLKLSQMSKNDTALLSRYFSRLPIAISEKLASDSPIKDDPVTGFELFAGIKVGTLPTVVKAAKELFDCVVPEGFSVQQKKYAGDYKADIHFDAIGELISMIEGLGVLPEGKTVAKLITDLIGGSEEIEDALDMIIDTIFNGNFDDFLNGRIETMPDISLFGSVGENLQLSSLGLQYKNKFDTDDVQKNSFLRLEISDIVISDKASTAITPKYTAPKTLKDSYIAVNAALTVPNKSNGLEIVLDAVLYPNIALEWNYDAELDEDGNIVAGKGDYDASGNPKLGSGFPTVSLNGVRGYAVATITDGVGASAVTNKIYGEYANGGFMFDLSGAFKAVGGAAAINANIADFAKDYALVADDYQITDLAAESVFFFPFDIDEKLGAGFKEKAEVNNAPKNAEPTNSIDGLWKAIEDYIQLGKDWEAYYASDAYIAYEDAHEAWVDGGKKGDEPKEPETGKPKKAQDLFGLITDNLGLVGDVYNLVKAVADKGITVNADASSVLIDLNKIIKVFGDSTVAEKDFLMDSEKLEFITKYLTENNAVDGVVALINYIANPDTFDADNAETYTISKDEVFTYIKEYTGFNMAGMSNADISKLTLELIGLRGEDKSLLGVALVLKNQNTTILTLELTASLVSDDTDIYGTSVPTWYDGSYATDVAKTDANDLSKTEAQERILVLLQAFNMAYRQYATVVPAA